MNLKDQRASTNVEHGSGIDPLHKFMYGMMQAVGVNPYAGRGWDPSQHPAWVPDKPGDFQSEEVIRAKELAGQHSEELHHMAQQAEANAAKPSGTTAKMTPKVAPDTITPGSLYATLMNMLK